MRLLMLLLLLGIVARSQDLKVDLNSFELYELSQQDLVPENTIHQIIQYRNQFGDVKNYNELIRAGLKKEEIHEISEWTYIRHNDFQGEFFISNVDRANLMGSMNYGDLNVRARLTPERQRFYLAHQKKNKAWYAGAINSLLTPLFYENMFGIQSIRLFSDWSSNDLSFLYHHRVKVFSFLGGWEVDAERTKVSPVMVMNYHKKELFTDHRMVLEEGTLKGLHRTGWQKNNWVAMLSFRHVNNVLTSREVIFGTYITPLHSLFFSQKLKGDQLLTELRYFGRYKELDISNRIRRNWTEDKLSFRSQLFYDFNLSKTMILIGYSAEEMNWRGRITLPLNQWVRFKVELGLEKNSDKWSGFAGVMIKARMFRNDLFFLMSENLTNDFQGRGWYGEGFDGQMDYVSISEIRRLFRFGMHRSLRSFTVQMFHDWKPYTSNEFRVGLSYRFTKA